tara:strand:- start:157 stop:858 length:702 start_codon:yes stop_codon:yes gene_type:complete
MATIDIGKLAFTHKGDYAGGTAYVANDVVYYNGSAYIAKTSTTGNLPTSTAHWNTFSAGSGGIWNSALSIGSEGQVVKVSSGALAFGTADDTYGTKLFHCSEGTFATQTTSSWTKLGLSVVRTNEVSGASLSNGVMTLPAGTYLSQSHCLFYRVNGYNARLRNTTDGADLIMGSGGHTWAPNDDASSCPAFMVGKFTLSAQKNVELQYYIEHGNNQTTVQSGHPNNVMLWKVA